MRTLLLMRGAPGCGKSTFIKQHGLEPYTLCADTLRLQYHSTHLNLDGDVCISQQYDNKVWNTLFDILEHRMQLGCFTVIDATNSKTKEMKRYKDLAATYRYRMYIVDMTDVPLEVCKERNANRPTYKRVPDAALENIYARFATQDVPSGIKVIKPDNINEILESKPFSYNDYENVHIIGDIHGCIQPLSKYLRTSYFCFDYDSTNYWQNKQWLSLEDLPNELWKDIDGYSGLYQISSYGRVKILAKCKRPGVYTTESIYKLRQGPDGYLYANLSKHSTKKTFKVHRLVAQHFGLDNCEEINHIDGAKYNNNIKNLECSDRKKNEEHCWKSGLKQSRRVTQFSTEGQLIKIFNSVQEAAELTNSYSTSIIKCCNGDYQTAGGYKWTYTDNLDNNRSGKSIRVFKYDLDDNFIAEYKSIKDAEKDTGVQSIRACLAGKLKTAGGYKWYCADIDYCNANKNTYIYNPEYLSTLLNPQDFYLFLGDYLDRGTQNAEVFKCLDSLKQFKNVLLLEGNHERWLNNWGNDIEDNLSGEFKNYTLPQLREARVSKKDCRNFYRKLAQCAFFTFGEQTYFCCHGGLSGLPNAGESLQFIPTRQMVHGVGRYADYEECTKWWNDTLDGNKFGLIQINGHRNINHLDIGATPFTYNLEGAVEFAGDLRIVKLSKNEDGVVTPNFIYIHNEEPVAEHLLSTKSEIGTSEESQIINNDTPIATLVSELRANKYINEKQFGNISSFNFSREAFNKGIWDNQTMRARGLYIDTVQNRIFARSYNKFWKLYEMSETQLPSLARSLKFPLKVYSKENGYLGLISYNYYDDSLFFTTKSSPNGDYTRHFKELFKYLVPKDKYDLLKEYLKTNDCTLTVEVVDPDFDPHIIEYDKAQIYLLDLVANTIEFSKQPFEAVLTLACMLDLGCKTHCATIYNWEQFEEFLNVMNTVGKTQELCHRDYIEGYVIEDAEGYMFKTKSDFYNFWKGLRSVAYQVIKSGNYRWTGSLQTPMANYFYKWIKDNWREYHDHPENKCDIITLRKEFLKSKYNIEEGQVN